MTVGGKVKEPPSKHSFYHFFFLTACLFPNWNCAIVCIHSIEYTLLGMLKEEIETKIVSTQVPKSDES